MKPTSLACTLLAVLTFGLSACAGDDDDSGGGASCVHVQMVCKDNADVTIDCDQFDSAPQSVKDCAGKAATCDAVTACLVAAAK